MIESGNIHTCTHESQTGKFWILVWIIRFSTFVGLYLLHETI